MKAEFDPDTQCIPEMAGHASSGSGKTVLLLIAAHLQHIPEAVAQVAIALLYYDATTLNHPCSVRNLANGSRPSRIGQTNPNRSSPGAATSGCRSAYRVPATCDGYR